MPQMTQPLWLPEPEAGFERGSASLRAIELSVPPSRRTGPLRGAIQALGQECGLCGHSRLWHHAHMIPWGRD